eukprot:775746-Rhodomonas_salina.1
MLKEGEGSREREDLVREPAGWAGRAHGARREPVQGSSTAPCSICHNLMLLAEYTISVLLARSTTHSL